MTDELLPYYHRELVFIRRMGAEFAKKYPKIASRLRLSAEGSQDPHVDRLIEAFAYLNARIQHKLDDDFPEITDALLSVLYPHFQRPIPSMAIVQFVLDRAQADLTAGHRITRGTAIDTEPVDGESCRYHTCFDTQLWPCELQAVTLASRPFTAPQTGRSAEARSVLRLSLSTFAPTVHFSQFGCDRLRFYLHATQQHNIHGLYELILNQTREICLATSAGDPSPVVLPATVLKSVGFDSSEAILPHSARMFAGYRLLTEYFSFPEKFLFFDLTELTPSRLAGLKDRMEIYFYLNSTIPELERVVSRDSIRLGCTPIVNLFPQRADPFVLTHTQNEYRVVPDVRRPKALEIYSIDKVQGVSPQSEVVEYQPFYSFKHGMSQEADRTFWTATRRPDASAEAEDVQRAGTEMFLSLVDLDFTPASRPDWSVQVETTCLNRSLPRLLPFGGGRPELELPDGRGPVTAIRCLTAPTPTIRAGLKHLALWKCISHLTLNHLSLSDAEEGADALREILRLYDLNESPEARNLLDGILSVSSRRRGWTSTRIAGRLLPRLGGAHHVGRRQVSGDRRLSFRQRPQPVSGTLRVDQFVYEADRYHQAAC